MITSERLDGLRQFIATTADISGVRHGLRELAAFDGDKVAVVEEIRSEAFERLARMTRDRPAEAAALIVSDLLPLALKEETISPDRNTAQRYVDQLNEWLEGMPPRARVVPRAAVLSELTNSLHGPNAERPLRLLARIGYRTPAISELLWRTVRLDPGPLGDIALRSLAAVGVPLSEEAEFVAQWRTRALQRWTLDLVAIASALATRECLDIVFDYWLSSALLGTTPPRTSFLPELTIAIPATIASNYPDDHCLQDNIWQQLCDAGKRAPDLFRNRVLGSHQLAPACNAPAVIQYYLAEVVKEARARFLVFARLEECVRPRQIEGWAAAVPDGVVKALRETATAGTGSSGRYMTTEVGSKRDAWQTLFSLANKDALTDLPAALASEQSGYFLHSIFQLAADFRVDPIPEKVRHLINGDLHREYPDENERLAAHLSAVDIAHASGSWSAFNALLEFVPVRTNGSVLIRIMDAIADNAWAIAQSGDQRAINSLWEAALLAPQGWHRSATAAALARLIRRGRIKPLPEVPLATLLTDTSLDMYARRTLADAVGNSSQISVPVGVIHALQALIPEPTPYESAFLPTEAGELGLIATASLVRLGVITQSLPRVLDRLGLKRLGGVWRLPSPGVVASPFILGPLYKGYPDEYNQAVADLIANGDWTVINQLIPSLEGGPRPVPLMIEEALLQRIKTNSPNSGEPDLIHLFAKLCPNRFASEKWTEFPNWPPVCRAALAESIARLSKTTEIPHNLELLVALMGDGQFGVRRSAYRALAGINSANLEDISISWAALVDEEKLDHEARAARYELRQRAAEAVCWFQEVPLKGPIADIKVDPEPQVRDTFNRSIQERRDRLWAAGYLQRVLEVSDQDSLFDAWRYGAALSRVGDDGVLDKLEEQRRREDLPAGVRHWLARLIKDLRSHWSEVTRKWPEPWFASRGAVEQLEVTFDELPGAGPFHCWLWLTAGKEISEYSSWGGWCPDADFRSEEHTLTLRVEGRRPGKVLVTHTNAPGGPTYFAGSGRYPSRL